MARDFGNKIILVTGGAEGIGFAIADKFLENGAKVVILLDTNMTKGAESEKVLAAKYGDNRIAFIKCDVTTDLEEVSRKVIEIYKTVDVLVNNAGIGGAQGADVRKVMGINATALIEWSLKFWEIMRKDQDGDGGTIINISSIYGFRIDQYAPEYKASKFAVMGFTGTLGHKYNYDRSGVRVVAICPGFTDTNLGANVKEIGDEQVALDFAKFVSEQPLQTADAVGDAAVEVFQRADSGTAWLIEGARPIEEIPFSYNV